MKLAHLNLALLLVVAGCCKQENASNSPVTKTVETRPTATTVTTTVTTTAKPEPPKEKAAIQPAEVVILKAEANKAGKIQITDSAGKTFTMVGNEYYRDAAVASNQRLLGATIGGNPEASGTSLVLFDNHLNKIQTYPSPNLYICHWDFWNNNTQLVLGGCPSHGPWTYALVDIKTGKQLETFYNPAEDCTKTPAWAKVPFCK